MNDWRTSMNQETDKVTKLKEKINERWRKSLFKICVLLTYYFIRQNRYSDMSKNIWSCILIYFLCANTQVIHYVYGPLLTGLFIRQNDSVKTVL